jgi:hypothetical protein
MLNKTMLSEYYKDVFEEKIVGLDTLTEYKVPEGRTRILVIWLADSLNLNAVQSFTLMRIRIQLLFNLDPDRGFDDQNIGKKCS